MVDDTQLEVETVDLLIVGAGPAGASLACFLGEYGMFLISTEMRN